MQNNLQWGSWNSICDVCGFKFKSTELNRRWDGLMVCSKDYEQRHPQDLIRSRGEKNTVAWSRPEPDNLFIAEFCSVWGLSAIPGFAGAGCAQPGKTFTGDIDWDVVLLSSTAVSGYAVSGSSISGNI